MGLRVNTNIMSLSAQRNLESVTDRLSDNYRRLSSGLRVAQAADDPAGLGISERMRAQIRSLGQAGRNAQDGVSLVQSAEGALAEVHANLDRMRELAIQAANGTYSDEDRGIIDVEFQELIEEIDRISQTTSFNGTQLLDGTQSSVPIQVGFEAGETISVDLVDTSATGLGIDVDPFDVTSIANANAVLAGIDGATDIVNRVRGDLGSMQNRLESTLRTIRNVSENLSSAESRIRDVDIATETADLTRNSIMQQAAVSVLSQVNTQPQIALSLLQG
jgi:flagellin